MMRIILRLKREMKNVLCQIRNRGLVKFGGRVYVEDSIFEGENSIAGGTYINNCKFGRGTYVSTHSRLAYTKVGRYCSIGDKVNVVLGAHPTDFVTTHPSFYYDTTSQIGYTYHLGEPLYNQIYKYPNGESFYQVVIGNDVWIGSHVLILGGVTIGDGAVIAAGGVVTHDIDPYTIVGGVPAKAIKKRFSKDVIEALLRIKWWNWSTADISERYKDFIKPEKFIEKYAAD